VEAGATSFPEVVDDDRGVRDALHRGLALEGFTVRDAADGAGPWRRSSRCRAIVVLDVMMPGMSGVEVVRRCARQGRTLPVCMLSARDEVDDRVAGLAAGADDYVVKPFSIGELAARLHALVRLHETTTDQRPSGLGRPGHRPAPPDRHPRRPRPGLTTREFDLLLTLASTPARCSAATSCSPGSGATPGRSTATWSTCSSATCASKLEAGGEPRILHTVRGVGFVLRP
jgi:two-component system response regulator PrrA